MNLTKEEAIKVCDNAHDIARLANKLILTSPFLRERINQHLKNITYLIEKAEAREERNLKARQKRLENKSNDK